MYEGVLEAISNREDWFVEFELIDNDTNVAIADLSDTTFKMQVRTMPPGGSYSRNRNNYLSDYYGTFNCATLLSAESGDAHTTVQDGVVEFHFTAQEMTILAQGAYEVGIICTREGITSQLLVATLPVVDGVIRP